MHPNFSQLTPRWFKRAFVYTGNIDDFRYRFEMDKDNGLLHTAVYTVYCFEVAKDVQQQDFPWDDQGVEQLKAWLQERYDHYTHTTETRRKISNDSDSGSSDHSGGGGSSTSGKF